MSVEVQQLQLEKQPSYLGHGHIVGVPGAAEFAAIGVPLGVSHVVDEKAVFKNGFQFCPPICCDSGCDSGWVLWELLPMLLLVLLLPGHVSRLCISWTGLTSKSSSSRRRSGVCTSLLWSDTE